MVVSVVAGVGLIVLAAVDGALTVLHPTRRGPVSLFTTKAVWVAFRAVARAVRRPGLLSGAGPVAVLAVFAGWTLLLWVGFALVYLPYTEQLSYSPSSTYGARDMSEALYLSGMSLTTVGYGDVTGGTDVLRLVTVAQAATGFGVITAAITYLLSVYPLTSALRGTARALESQAAHPGAAADLVVAGGVSYLHDLHKELISIDEDTERFPLIYFYRSRNPGASMNTLMRGAVMVSMQARWGVSTSAAPGARTYGEEMTRTLDVIFEHFVRRFLLRSPDRLLDRTLDLDDARERLDRLIRAAGEAGRRPGCDDAGLRSFATFAGRAEAFLGALAEHQLRERRHLLTEEVPVRI